VNARTHVPLFLLALAIAILIKVMVHETEQLSDRTFPVNVTYTLQPGTILTDSVEEVRVQLRGKTGEITQLNPFALQVVVAIDSGRRGTIDVNLDSSDVRTPGDFEIISISPNQLSLTVEEVMTKLLPVKVRWVDEPAAGSIPGEPEVRPSRVQVTGPASQVEPLEELTTSVSLRGHALTFEDTVSVLSPDPQVKVEPSRVVVFVPMNPPVPLSELDGEATSESGESP